MTFSELQSLVEVLQQQIYTLNQEVSQLQGSMREAQAVITALQERIEINWGRK